MPDRRVALIQCAAQFRYQRGRPERAVGHLLTHIDIITTQAWAATREVELTSSPNVILEVVRTLIVGGGVDSRAEVDGWLPVEIIMRVVALCDPDVYPAEATCGTLALKEHQTPVA